MIITYPTYEGLVSIWPIGKLGAMRTIQLPKNISTQIFPEPKTPSLEELKEKFVQQTNIFSNPILRNARLFAGEFPMQQTRNFPIYTTSMRKLQEGYLVGVLTKEFLPSINILA